MKERLLASAIQEKRPWWHALPHYALAIPAGAAAAFAVGFIVWRNALPRADEPQAATLVEAGAQPAAAPFQANAPAIVASGINTPGDMPATTVAIPAQNTGAETAVTSSDTGARHDTARDTRVPASSATRDRNFARATAAFSSGRFVGAKTITSATLFTTPASIVGDLPALATVTPGSPPPVTAAARTATHAGESTAGPGRERLMAYINDELHVVGANASDNPRINRLRDRMASRINDKALTDTISRIDAIGDRVTIKF